MNASAKNTNNKKETTDDVFMMVQEMPTFPGGKQALNELLRTNLEYPKIAHENGIAGRVIVSFIVEKDGSLSNIKIEKGVDPALDEEAVKFVKSLPNWNPGKQKGNAVRVKQTLPINFNIS